MIIKVTLGRWRFTWSMAPTERVVGVNSQLPDGNHILMWDFDDIVPSKLIDTLKAIQATYALPTIYILITKPLKYTDTGKGDYFGIEVDHLFELKGNFIAYCFKRVEWPMAVEIIAATRGVDYNYFKFGVYRRHFTLRVTPKSGRKPTLWWKLYSNMPEDVNHRELRSWVRYQTLPDGYNSKKYEVNIVNANA